jgi:general secretion pathway protein J
MRARQAGFTLLELLVALVVLGLLMLALTQGTRFGLTAWEMQARGIATRDDLAAADRALRRMIEQMHPGTADEEPHVAGLPGALSFRTELPLPAGVAPATPVQAALGVVATQRLVLRWTPYPAATRLGPPAPAVETVLLRGVDHLELAYWRPARRGDAGGWQRDWRLRELPGLVRIRIVFPPGDPRHWPDIVAAPMRARLLP